MVRRGGRGCSLLPNLFWVEWWVGDWRRVSEVAATGSEVVAVTGGWKRCSGANSASFKMVGGAVGADRRGTNIQPQSNGAPFKHMPLVEAGG